MLLRVIGGLALLLLLVHPAKADGITTDDFTVENLSWSLPSTISGVKTEPIEGTVDYWVDANVDWGSLGTLPSTIIFDIPYTGDGIVDGYQYAVECGTYCDGDSFAGVSQYSPIIISGDTITFVPGVYGLLTITADGPDVPEPGGLYLIGVGLLALVALRCRMRTRCLS
ncbi:MAG TPA: PEP-CTERM sorting domain-containing protein [Candidatus Baltobacteraceae bacterium]|nr:PEP-CTERM sorting domain-containing protein [Candidatus Baltobacteraceae bacterium]